MQNYCVCITIQELLIFPSRLLHVTFKRCPINDNVNTVVFLILREVSIIIVDVLWYTRQEIELL